LASVALNPTSVTGGAASQGTVTLSSAAPAGGSVVSLSSNNSAVAAVPPTVTVAAGASSTTFTVTTSSVATATPVTITASFSGANQTTTLTVNPAPLMAAFTVTSSSRGNNACVLIAGGNELDCTFDGSPSTGPIRTWRWVILVGSQRREQDSSDPRTRPQAGCGFLANGPVSEAGGVRFVQMEVRLRVADARGVESSEAVNRDIRMFPNGNCNYGF
jgi:hypothetical protein